MPKILDGRLVSNLLSVKLKQQVAKLKQKPHLVIVQVGDLPASNLYIKRKIKFGEQIGVRVSLFKYQNTISEAKLKSEINKLNKSRKITGIIVQLPLPEKLDKQKIINSVALEKDVDGLRAGSAYTPATARGVLTLLDFYKIKMVGKKVVVVGRSNLVGKPIALALLARGATVTICHRQTKNLAQETKQADILIVAAGAPNLIKPNFVKREQVVVDVGLSLLENGKLTGDVDAKKVRKIIHALSPVPGGVGPMTVAALFINVVDAVAY